MMKVLFVMSLIAGQAITGRVRTAVRLPPNTKVIPAAFDGRLLELVNSPPTIYLPMPPPANIGGAPWTLEIKNDGPRQVIIACGGTSRLLLNVGQSTVLFSSGRRYFSQTHRNLGPPC